MFKAAIISEQTVYYCLELWTEEAHYRAAAVFVWEVPTVQKTCKTSAEHLMPMPNEDVLSPQSSSILGKKKK